MTSELASIDAAITEATTRLDRARQQEAHKADREAAKQLRETYAHFQTLAEQADQALASFLKASVEMKTTMDRIHALGGEVCRRTQACSRPTSRSQHMRC